jgi:hypothetical protein
MAQGGQINEGLERRARLAACFGGAVELAVHVVSPADDRPDRAVGLHGDEGGLGGIEGGAFFLEHFVDDPMGRLVHFDVERRLDLENVVAPQPVLVEQIHGFAVGPVQQVVGAVEVGRAHDLGRPAPGIEELSLGDVADIEHAMEHHIGARPGQMGVDMRGKSGRGLEQTGQHGGFRQGDVADRLAEIELRRRLHAIGAAAEIRPVEIHLQDLVLAQPGLDPHGKKRLVDLAAHAALRRQEQILGQLLGDRRATLHDPVGAGILHRRARRALDVDAEMSVEARILGGQHRHGGHAAGFPPAEWRHPGGLRADR